MKKLNGRLRRLRRCRRLGLLARRMKKLNGREEKRSKSLVRSQCGGVSFLDRQPVSHCPRHRRCRQRHCSRRSPDSPPLSAALQSASPSVLSEALQSARLLQRHARRQVPTSAPAPAPCTPPARRQVPTSARLQRQRHARRQVPTYPPPPRRGSNPNSPHILRRVVLDPNSPHILRLRLLGSASARPWLRFRLRFRLRQVRHCLRFRRVCRVCR